MSETRTRRRIRRAVESRGFTVKELTWEPIYNAGEMSGYAGGWLVVVEPRYAENTWPGDDLCGLSADELLAFADWALKPPEPCGCNQGRPGRFPLMPTKGDPEKPLHEPSCRWHIEYRMPWWKTGDETNERRDA